MDGDACTEDLPIVFTLSSRRLHVIMRHRKNVIVHGYVGGPSGINRKTRLTSIDQVE